MFMKFNTYTISKFTSVECIALETSDNCLITNIDNIVYRNKLYYETRMQKLQQRVDR
jgi:hypothetical protein